jgi:signal peptidase I
MKSAITLAVLIIVAILLFITGLAWLGFAFLTTAGIVFLYRNIPGRTQILLNSKWIKIPVLLAVTLITAVFIRLFIFEVFDVPSNSMESTLLPGDRILVNKLKIGPVTPDTPFEIPWFNLFFYMNKTARANIDSAWWGKSRLNGINKLGRGDVVVFKSTWDRNFFLVKRCVAIAGDSFSLVDGDIYIGGKPQATFTELIVKKYILYSQDKKGLMNALQQASIPHEPIGSGPNKPVLIETTDIELHNLFETFAPDSFSKYTLSLRSKPFCFPFDSVVGWNIDQLGPVLVPARGNTIMLNDHNFAIYHQSINGFEKANIVKKGSLFYRNGKVVHSYTFRYSYCFMMGDNRNYSLDSRYIGFVPETQIIGKVTRVLWSFHTGIMKWNRIYMKIK